jgi:sugar lactone lactonase YvrE
LYPESIAFDPVSGDFFLGSMSQPRILRIHPDRSYEDFLSVKVPELASSIGMKADAERRTLWVCTGRFSLLADYEATPPRTGVLQFDIDSGKLVRSWMLDQEQESPYHIFNDIALTATGEAFVTTTLLGRTYKITPGFDGASHRRGRTASCSR